MEHEHEAENLGAMKSRTDAAPAYRLWSLVIVNSPVFMYPHLAEREERDARAQFEEAYTRCAANTPAFFPRIDATVHA